MVHYFRIDRVTHAQRKPLIIYKKRMQPVIFWNDWIQFQEFFINIGQQDHDFERPLFL